jgi:hypothetical protein
MSLPKPFAFSLSPNGREGRARGERPEMIKPFLIKFGWEFS